MSQCAECLNLHNGYHKRDHLLLILLQIIVYRKNIGTNQLEIISTMHKLSFSAY